MSLPRLLRRLSHRRARERARHAARVTALVAAVLTAAGVAVVVPTLSGAEAASPAVPAGSPTGVAEHMLLNPGGMRFTGWASDPNTTKPITVYITVDGKKVTSRGGSVVADDARPDLAKTHPTEVGHGYDTSILIPAGKHVMCAWAKNVGAGKDRQLRCVTRTLDYDPLVGVQSFTTAPGAVHVAGWAYDSDAPATALRIAVSVDGKLTKTTASRANAQVRQLHPEAGAEHGFVLNVPAAQGSHRVCIGAYNVSYGHDSKNVKCGTLTLSDSPVGALNTLARYKNTIEVRGWGYDPDSPTSALTVALTIDGKVRNVAARLARADVAKAHPSAGQYHGFQELLALGEGTHRVCVTLINVSYGSNRALDCRTVALSFTPTAAVTSLKATSTGLTVSGWTSDPDTTKAIKARITVNGATKSTLTASAKASSHSGHAFTAAYALRSGKQTVCVTGLNVGYGTHNSAAACRSITLALSPVANFYTVTRAPGSSTLLPRGWAFDPDTTASIKVRISVDGVTVGAYPTTVARADVPRVYPSAGSKPHGFLQAIAASAGEHTVCVVALNVGGGADRSLGCKVINAVHPVAPSAPRSVKATVGYGTAKITWAAPASDGGAPWTRYTVTSGKTSAKVAAATTSYQATNLKAKTKYTFYVTATNVGGTSARAAVTVTTPSGPPPQTTPAPVSTSRYIRNIKSATSSDLATMKREGAADAAANPSGHRYLILLDIGGQTQGGVVLSATTHFVSYANLVKDLEAYVAGYHSKQRGTAPVTIAIGTNNDIDVSAASGKAWADSVIDKVRSYVSTQKYADMSVAGANDIEPGFRGTYAHTKAWLSGYLGATSAAFVFNGSADGCAWTTTDRQCNNGWSMKGLYYLSKNAARTRSMALPQIYNTTMAAQWKYISLTGIKYKDPRINFGGPLTEWTACDQARSCGSLTGKTAWAQLWKNLQSDSRLKVTSLPYSTDLRIDS